MEPASASSIAGLKKLVESGEVDQGEDVVCIVTGHLLKDPNTAINACKEPLKIEADAKSLAMVLKQL